MLCFPTPNLKGEILGFLESFLIIPIYTELSSTYKNVRDGHLIFNLIRFPTLSLKRYTLQEKNPLQN